MRSLAPSRRSDVEHRPTDVVSYPLIVEDQFADRLRELLTLPVALNPAGLFVGFGGGGASRLDGVSGGTEFVGRDVRHHRRLAGRKGGMASGSAQLPGRSHGVATGRPRLRHPDFAAGPRPDLLDRLAGPPIRRLHRLEEGQHVLGARRRPQREEPMVGVREGPPAADGDEAPVAVLGQDHGCTIDSSTSYHPDDFAGYGDAMNLTAPDLAAQLTDRRLLDHRFYRRWELGEVSMPELGSYAAQYRHYESYLPRFLARLVAELPDGPARSLIAANLADEEGDPVAHVVLFEGFARAVGAGNDAASPATEHLLATYDDLLAEGPGAALAGFVAYECQASEVAQRKADGLRHWYGLDEEGVAFWAHHAHVDVRHGAWARRALEGAAGDGPCAAVRRAADAWWNFLDEREVLAHTG